MMDAMMKKLTSIEAAVHELRSDVAGLKSEMAVVSRIAYTTCATTDICEFDPFLLGHIIDHIQARTDPDAIECA